MLSAATMLCLTANLAFLPGIASAAHSSGKSSRRCEPTKVYNFTPVSGSISSSPATVATFTAPSDCAYALNASVNVTSSVATAAGNTFMCGFADNGTSFGNIASYSALLTAGNTITLSLSGFRQATSQFPDTFTVQCMVTGPVLTAFPSVAATGNAVAARQGDIDLG